MAAALLLHGVLLFLVKLPGPAAHAPELPRLNSLDVSLVKPLRVASEAEPPPGPLTPTPPKPMPEKEMPGKPKTPSKETPEVEKELPDHLTVRKPVSEKREIRKKITEHENKPDDTGRKAEPAESVPGAANRENSGKNPKPTPGENSSSVAAGPVIREAMPLYLENEPPEYPLVARKKRYQGTVELEVLVRVDGSVGDARVFKTSGYPVLDKAALRAVVLWRFEPGTQDARPVAMWVNCPVRFELTE